MSVGVKETLGESVTFIVIEPLIGHLMYTTSDTCSALLPQCTAWTVIM